MTLQDFIAGAAKLHTEVLHDYGLYRHVALCITDKKGVETKLDITTAPNQLTVRGDSGPFFFAGRLDLFGHFRLMEKSASINPNYWARYLISGEARHWCPHYARQCVTDAFNQWTQQQSCIHFVGAQLARINNELKLFADDEHEFTRLLRGWVPDKPGILIHDLIDTDDLKPYSEKFIFTCYAVAWAVSQFDERVTTVPHHKPIKAKPFTTTYQADSNSEGDSCQQ